MTIHTYHGLAVVREEMNGNDVVTEVQYGVRLTLGVPDSETTFSYTITNSPPANDPDLSEVDISINDFLAAFNDISIAQIESQGQSVISSIGQVGWGAGKVTQILAFEVDNGDGSSTELYFRLGGDAFPVIDSVADWDAFDNSITSIGEIPGSSPLAEGKNIAFTSLPDRSTYTDNPINGTNGADNLFGTAGNDVIDPGTNGGDVDYIRGSAGNDFIVLSDSQAGDFYNLDYSYLASPITVTLDDDWAEGFVEKASGTDRLVDFGRAVRYETGDGMWIDATSGDDEFNINLDDDSWLGLSAKQGDDTFNLSGDGIIRLNFRGGTSGINVNLATGAVQDGYGDSDQINVANGSPLRVEIEGTDNTDTITGSGRDERFILHAGNDTLNAGGGWDELRYDRSGVGAVTVNLANGTATGTWDGMAFSHTISGIEQVRGSRNDGDSITGDGNDNWFRGRGGNDTLNGGGGDDTLVGEEGNDRLNGGAGDDVAEFWINRADATITQSGGNVTVVSSLGTDVLTGIERLAFNDQEVFIDASGATNGPDTLTGTAGDDSIDGLDGNDRISGLAGNDGLRGSGGNDTLLGGNGRDTLWGGDGNDLLNPGDNDQDWDLLEPGAGNDTVDFGQMLIGGGGIYHWSLDAGIIATINGNTNTGTINKGANGTTTILDVVNPMTDWGFGIQGTEFNDTFNLTVLDDGWSSIENSAGNDTINIGASTGALRLDYRIYDTPVSGVNANLATGIIQDGYGGTDTVNGINQVERFEIRLSDETDTVLGSAHSESFILREGNDTLDGGAGRDLLRYDRSGVDSSVIVNLKTGIATGTWNGNAFTHTISNVEEVRGSRNDNDTLIGNAADNALDGRGGNDSLLGNDGNDTLTGGDGNDTLKAGNGNDLLNTGSGDDLAFGGNGNDTLTGFGDNDTLDGGAGIDLLLADLSDGFTPQSFIWDVDLNRGTAFGRDPGTLAPQPGGQDTITGIENVQLIGDFDVNFFGNAAANLLQSSDGDDILDGRFGNDTLLGGSGDDSLLGGAGFDTLEGGNGNDTLNGGDGRDLARMGAGNDLYQDNGQTGVNGQDTVFGNQGNDTIEGGAGDDVFYGDLDNDVIRGRLGNDKLFGGDGADILDGGDGNDTINGGNGRDKVIMGNGADLYQDNGQGGVNGQDTVNGNQGNDTIEGGAGNDVFFGDLDNDVLRGRLGNDKLYGGDGFDTLEGGDGNDSVWGGNGRDRALLGNGNDVFFDNGQGGTLGQDTVFGGNGFDTINGGGGNDVIQGNNGNDRLLGGGGNDKLYGGNNADVLLAGDGADSLWGGNGLDQLTGGNGLDTFFFADGFGSDTVFGFDAADGEKINLAGVTNITDFNDLITNHLVNAGGTARIVDGANGILLNGVSFADVGVGLDYSADDFLF